MAGDALGVQELRDVSVALKADSLAGSRRLAEMVGVLGADPLE